MPKLQRVAGSGEQLVGGVLELATPTSCTLAWQIPGDNGVLIDHYLLSYYMVSILAHLMGQHQKISLFRTQRVGGMLLQACLHRQTMNLLWSHIFS